MPEHENGHIAEQYVNTQLSNITRNEITSSDLVAISDERTVQIENDKPILTILQVPGYRVIVNGKEFDYSGKSERRAKIKDELLKMLLRKRLPEGGSAPITRDEIKSEFERQQIEFTEADIVGIADLRPNIKFRGKSVVDRVWSETVPAIQLNPDFNFVIDGERVIKIVKDVSGNIDDNNDYVNKDRIEDITPPTPLEKPLIHYHMQRESVVREWTSPPLPIVESFANRPQRPVHNLPDISTSHVLKKSRYDETFIRPDSWDDVVPVDEEISGEIDTGNLYTRLIKRYKVLSRDEEIALFKRLEAGDADAKEKLIKHNLRLVPYVLRKKYGIVGIGNELHRGGAMNTLDLIQEGYLGLLKAIEKHDFYKGYKFSSFAPNYIKQEIGRALDNQSRTIRIPVHKNEALRSLKKTQYDLSQKIGREAAADDIASEVDVPAEKIKEIFHIENINNSIAGIYGDEPLGSIQPDVDPDEFENDPDNIPTSDMNPDIEKYLIDKTEEDVLDQTIRDIDIKPIINEVLDSLSDRERQVLRLRFGLDEQKRTLEEIGIEFGVTRERIRQIEVAVLKKLRKSEYANKLRNLL